MAASQDLFATDPLSSYPTAQPLRSIAMESTSEEEFCNLKNGQRFLFMNLVYCKRDDRSAVLVQSEPGEKPTSKTVHNFYPEDIVVPLKDAG
tara:strand:+ start:8440 stop:8715 length:276 start_codon:yes stop_codon:yes gene_type:complete